MSLWRLRSSSKLSSLELGLVKLSETVDFWAFKGFFRPVKFRFISSSQVFVIFICKDFFLKNTWYNEFVEFSLFEKRGRNPEYYTKGVYHG